MSEENLKYKILATSTFTSLSNNAKTIKKKVIFGNEVNLQLILLLRCRMLDELRTKRQPQFIQ